TATGGGGTKVATLTAAAGATMGFGGAGSRVSGSLLVVVPLPTGRGDLTAATGGRAGAGIQIVSPLPASSVSHSRMLRCEFSDSTRNRKPAWPGLVQANSQPAWIGRAASGTVMCSRSPDFRFSGPGVCTATPPSLRSATNPAATPMSTRIWRIERFLRRRERRSGPTAVSCSVLKFHILLPRGVLRVTLGSAVAEGFPTGN